MPSSWDRTVISGQGDNRKNLLHRENYVISSRYEQDQHTQVVVYKSLLQYLAGIANRGYKKYDDVWILGGEKLFREAVPFNHRLGLRGLTHV